MLNEPASSLNDEHPEARRELTLTSPSPDPLYSEIRDAVNTVLHIDDEDVFISEEERRDYRRKGQLVMIPLDSQLLMIFKGQLKGDSEAAYDRLDMLFMPHDLVPVFRNEDGQHAIYVIEGRVRPAEGGQWLSLVLFIATLLSVLLAGTQIALNQIAAVNPAEALRLSESIAMQLWRGIPYASGILLILGAHELGHYFMARRHKTAASLPYFLPFPLGLFGTFGAAIRLREPLRNRKVLMDVGAGGPLVGLVFAIPVLFLGLATSPVAATSGAGLVEGNSLLYALAKTIVFGRFLPSGGEDVFLNQLAFAGWTGLLVTGLNLIPVGQLDGGHVLYSLLGKWARYMYYPVMGALLLLSFFVAQELLFFAFLVLFLGSVHAVPLDDVTPLDPRRRWLSLLTLALFFVVFVPQPFNIITPSDSGPTPTNPTVWLALFFALLWTSRRRLFELLRRGR